MFHQQLKTSDKKCAKEHRKKERYQDLKRDEKEREEGMGKHMEHGAAYLIEQNLIQ